LPLLEHLHFAGGEPLIIPQMAGLLRLCVERGYAQNIMLTYNTNLTRISDDLKKLWPKFKAVHLYISVDAYGDLNDFIRHPSRWKVIDKNLKDIDQNFKEYGIEYAAIMTTAQLYNIFHLGELYDYLFANMKNVMKLPKLIDLYVPTQLRTQVLPAHLKALARERLNEILLRSERRLNQELIPSSEAGTLDTLRGTIAFLDLEDHSSELNTFKTYTRALDTVHKKNTLDVIPELASILLEAQSAEHLESPRFP
jgi:sulfatase maturation enzyme AslB (radical SAM superfamily)